MTLCDENGRDIDGDAGSSLYGTIVSVARRAREENEDYSILFVFGDLSVRTKGKFKLKFHLHDVLR